MTAARWVGVGESAERDSASAGAIARAAAVEGHDDVRLLIVFASAAHDLSALLAGIAPGDVPLVGCTTAGEIGTSGPGDHGVVVLALGGEGFTVRTTVAADVSTRLREAGAEAARCLDTLDDRPYRALLLLADGLAGNQEELVRGAYEAAGSAIPLVGGGAGDDLALQATFQFHGEQVLRDAVVGVALGSDAPIGIGVKHGWRRVGEPVLVTSSGSGRVLTLDDRPALDVYLERLDAPEAAHTDPAAFRHFALCHPLGLSRRSGEDHARFIAEADFEARSISAFAEVPEGAIAWFMAGDAESVLDATDAACRTAVDALGGAPVLGVLAFDCIARRHVLGDDGIQAEVARIRDACAGAPLAGLYTYGEIARRRGISGYHNQTLVVLALA